ncbi:radical SAM family heme chaperone HemW [Gloeobacter morelensis]|uniref:Coproporphyrinogen-III oxidase n=1 Tax=Gloeobacter morelensis MG652769 TaxID=2781736 RepID=A0ABY3PH59_9CYAN|nr:radical SAM family heme chaperone HemW [Gloeobacter morelensis]UFP92975.1 coproporphyrinogen III oxidase [Gloeobacter morelensis MG652769]
MERQDEANTQIIASTVPHPPCATLPQTCPGRFGGLPTAAYVHIPFCRTRCRYCDFAVTVGTEGLIEKYVRFLLAEIALTPSGGQGLDTVYFGGGTPSLLSVEQLGRVLTALREHFGGFAPDAEISLEANPGTFDYKKLTGYRSLGVNRLSVGVQAFQPHLLALCGRSHRLEDIYSCVATVRAAGFENFNLDLIFGLPHQSLADWEFSLAEVLRLEPAHLSLYDLILEEETPFGRQFLGGQAPLPGDDDTVTMYLRACERLQAHGYRQYEIANFARPGFRCRHNRVYWDNRPYYGIGNGATGYVWGARVERPRRLHDYFVWVERGEFPAGAPVLPEEALSDTLLLGLRLLEGVEVSALVQRFGQPAVARRLAALQSALERGLLILSDGRLRLSVPEGLLLSNEVFMLLV